MLRRDYPRPSAPPRALETLRDVLPNFTPSSMADVGAGPGTVSLAALTCWPELRHFTLIEPNKFLQKQGEDILRAAAPTINVSWHAVQAAGYDFALDSHDFVAAGYVLNEIAQEKGRDAVADCVRRMWRAARGAIMIVEPGTPAGQDIVLLARDILIAENAHIAAPCPHTAVCPVAALWPNNEKWCHFSIRVERSRTHRQIKQQATLGYEDEKFSYIIATHQKPDTPAYRIIGRPRGTKVIKTETCAASGCYEELNVSKSAADYKTFRKSVWGDGIKK